MSRIPRLFVISGPSGVGKGTLVSHVRERRPELGLTVSATTRAPRPGEIENVSYYYLSEDEFSRLVSEDAFLEHAGNYGNRYGTLWSEVRPSLEEGRSVILEIDVQGAINVRNVFPDAVLLFIAPPSLEELEKRLRSRGTESEEQVLKRLARAKDELELASLYDEVIVNDDLELAVDKLDALIESYETDERTRR